jgi:hypothetical protein
VTARRGRKPGFQMTERHRSKIANSQILNRLVAFASGDETVKMSPAQVTAALGLLKKVMPDLASIENTGQSQVAFVIRAPEPVALASDWERLNAPGGGANGGGKAH